MADCRKRVIKLRSGHIQLLLIKISQARVIGSEPAMQKSFKKISISPDIASFQPNKSPLLSPTSISTSNIVASISAFSEKYRKQIESVVKIQESLYDGKMPQKCLSHNINYTLYCETDHKILCTRCMYQNNMHKLHTVKPLNQCVEMIGRDCSKLEKEVERTLQKLQEYAEYANAQVTRIERQYPPAKDKIQQLYKYLHQFLFDQEKQSIKTLRAYKAILLEQQRLLTKQILRIKTYVEQKVNRYKSKYGEDELLTKKNILAVLMNSEKIIIEQLKINLKNKEEKYKFGEGLKQLMKEYFEESLNKMFPWGKCKPIMKDKQAKKETEKGQNQSAEKGKKQENSPKKSKIQTPKHKKSSLQKTFESKKARQSKKQTSPSKQSIAQISKSPKQHRAFKNLFSSKSKKKISNNPNYESRSQLMMKNSLLAQNSKRKSQRVTRKSESSSKSKEKLNKSNKKQNKIALQKNPENSKHEAHQKSVGKVQKQIQKSTSNLKK